MIHCNRCNLQYMGEAKRCLKDRLNEHRCTDTKSKPTKAAEHFLSFPNHTANDMQLIPIEKIFSNRDSIRKARTIDSDDVNSDEKPLSSVIKSQVNQE